MIKRPDEARVQTRALGDLTAEVYLSAATSRPDLWQVRVVFFAADRTPLEEHVIDHPRNKRLVFRIDQTRAGAFVMPDPAQPEEVFRPPPRSRSVRRSPARKPRKEPAMS